MNEQQARRLVANEALFRSVNDRLVELNEAFAALDERALFVCECAKLACIEQIEMSLEEYAKIRRNPRRFFVAASDGHVAEEIETVVERCDGYFVVEKTVATEVVETPSQRRARPDDSRAEA